MLNRKKTKTPMWARLKAAKREIKEWEELFCQQEQEYGQIHQLYKLYEELYHKEMERSMSLIQQISDITEKMAVLSNLDR